jgi:hypothetical protein
LFTSVHVEGSKKKKKKKKKKNGLHTQKNYQQIGVNRAELFVFVCAIEKPLTSWCGESNDFDVFSFPFFGQLTRRLALTRRSGELLIQPVEWPLVYHHLAGCPQDGEVDDGVRVGLSQPTTRGQPTSSFFPFPFPSSSSCGNFKNKKKKKEKGGP